MLKEEDILAELGSLFGDYSSNNVNNLDFGDFLWENAYVSQDIPLTL
jgi:hypothetical protein